MVDVPTRASIRDKLYQFLGNDNAFKTWKVVETSTVEYGTREGIPSSVYRLTCDMDVSIQAFRAFCSSTANMKMADPNVASIDIPYIDDHSRVECIHIKGKGSSLTAARDFCTYQTMDTLEYDALNDTEKRLVKDLARIADGPITKGISRGARVEYPTQVFVLSAVDSKTVPEIPDYVRATVHSLGYIAFPLTDNLIRVVYLSCVDPKGNIPKFALDAANAETAGRIESIKTYCKVLDNVSRALEFPFPQAACDIAGKESPAEVKRASKKIEKTQSIKSSSSVSTADQKARSSQQHVDPVAAAAPESKKKESSPPAVDPTPVSQRKADTTSAAPDTEEGDTPGFASPMEQEEEDEAVVETKPLTPEEMLPERLRITSAKRAHFDRMLNLHKNNNWRVVKTLENCLLEEQEVDFTIFKAVRISSDFNCSIATLMQVLGEQKHMKVYDPKLETFEIAGEDKTINGVKVYSAYKRESRFISPRDFYTLSTATLLNTPEAIAKEGLGKDAAMVYVQGSQSIEGRPEVTGWVRGFLHVFGYVVYADEVDSTRIKVYNVMCADPNGSIPKFAMDAANADSCKKLAIIRRLCEEQQQRAPASLPVAEPVAAVTPATKKATASAPASKAASPSIARQLNPSKPTSPTSAKSGGKGGDDSDAESSASFQSCLDEDEVQKDMQSMRQFYFNEVDSVINRLISLHNFDGWTLKETIESCRLETVLTPLCDKKAVRASCEMHCTIDDFWNVISNINLLRRYDQDLEKLDVLKSPPYGTVMHTSYRGAKGVTSRDFCTITASKFLSDEEGSDANLYTPGFNASALVVNSLDCDDYPEQKNYVRGRVFAHGFIAVATPPSAKRIRVFHLALIDPQGSIPTKLADMAATQLATKLNTIKNMCESQHLGELAHVADTASYMVQKARGGDSDAPIEPMSILGPMLRQHANAHWSNTTLIHKCTVQTAELEDNPNMMVVRASMEVPCTLSIFESVVNNSDSRRRLDENIESLRFLPGPPNATVSLVGFRRDDSKAPHANCAFCEISMGKQLNANEIVDFELSSMKAAVYVHNGIGWEHGLNKEQLSSFGSYDVGRLNINGYMGIAIPPTAPRIRVSHQWCVTTYNPKTEVTGDKKHKKNLEYIKHELASRLIMLAAMCQDRQGLREEALYQVGGGNSSSRARANSYESDLGARAANTEVTQASPRTPEQEQSTPPTSPPRGTTASEAPVPSLPIAKLEEPTASCSGKDGVDLSDRDIFTRLLDLQKRHDWSQVKVVDECVLENATVDYCRLNANKVSSEFACELETFKEFMGNADKLKEYDPKLETLKHIKTIDGDIQLLYSAYKRESRLIAPREFLTRNIAMLLSNKDAVANGLLKPSNVDGAAFIQVSRSYAEDADYHEVEKGWVRGFIHAHGYVAIREGPKGCNKIKIYSISCVDPNGSIPKFAMDAAAAQTCKTIALIRTLCEEEQQQKH